MNITENQYQETDLGNIAPNPKGEYSDSEIYEYLDFVYYQGGSYLCLAELDNPITGISPEINKTTEYWQIVALPGGLTPEFVSAHDNVVNLAEQVENSATEVRTAHQNVSSMKENVTQMQEQVRQYKESAEQSKESVDSSRQVVERSEQNINDTVTRFNSHVEEKVSEVDSAIGIAKTNAISSIVKQQEDSIQEVKDQTSTYIIEKQKEAESSINTVGETKKKEIEDTGTEKKNEVVEAITKKGAETLDSIPKDYTGLQTEVDGLKGDLSQIDERVTTLEAGGVPSAEIEKAVSDYLTENPPVAVDAYTKAESDAKYALKGEGGGSSDMVGASVKWNEPALDIINRHKLGEAIKLTPDGHFAHNACIVNSTETMCAWSEDVSGGTSDNANSNNVHGKMKFIMSAWGLDYKADSDSLKLTGNDITYDIFPVDTVIDGHTVVSDSDHMMFADGANLHIFGMVKFEDNVIRVCHTHGTTEKQGTGPNRTATYTSSGEYEVVQLSVDGVVGEYDFSRVDSSWMKTPQINTNPYLNGSNYEFALSINGKAVALMKFAKDNPTVWEYTGKVDANDINLEVSRCLLSWSSNATPTTILAYRTNKGYACIVGMHNGVELQRFYLPAANSRVRLVKLSKFKCALACENIGRGDASIYTMNLDVTGHLSNPVQIWHSTENTITDYIDILVASKFLIVVGTNGGAKAKNGISACVVVYDSTISEYAEYNEHLLSALVNEGVTDDHINDLIDAKLGVIENGSY